MQGTNTPQEIQGAMRPADDIGYQVSPVLRENRDVS